MWLATGRWFSPGTLVSSTNKTDNHDITEILLKVALNTINQTKPYKHDIFYKCIHSMLSVLEVFTILFLTEMEELACDGYSPLINPVTNLDYYCVKEGDCPEKSYCHINFHKCCKEGMSSLILLMYLMNCRKFWACLTIEGQRSTWLLPEVICF
jgi:hypothetical protein